MIQKLARDYKEELEKALGFDFYRINIDVIEDRSYGEDGTPRPTRVTFVGQEILTFYSKYEDLAKLNIAANLSAGSDLYTRFRAFFYSI